MGKSKKNKVNKPENQVKKPGQNPSKQTQKKDGKQKKVKQEDHLKHIPFRLREIMKSKDRMKKASLRVKKPKNAASSHTKPADVLDDGDIPVPHFKRGKHESEGAYIRRMDTETQHVLFLSKNQVDRKPELDTDKPDMPAGKSKSERKKEYDKIKVNRLQKKKLDRQESEIEKEMFVDNVPFGEVTMAPPSLTAKPKKAQLKSQTSKELLLNSLLGHTVVSTAKPSMARQRLMEEERQRVVQAYRQLKKQKQLQTKTRRGNVLSEDSCL